MSQRSRQLTFDSLIDPEPPVKNPKKSKTKFMKDLNYKSNFIIRQQRNHKLDESLKQKEYIMKKQRTRKNSEFQQIEMKSLLERMIPGAKIIKGEWKDHKLNGYVQIQYDNLNRFVGKYQNGVRVEGKMTYPELKCEYEGSFFAQKFSGFGKLSYEGGRVIQGEWENMEFIGNATITYPNKDVYYGPVDQKLYKHGQGYLFLHNGYKYIGSFSHGSITGIGSYYKDDVLMIKGQWLKGKLIKPFGIGQETQVFDESLSPNTDSDMSAMKLSSESILSYRFREKDEIQYVPKQIKTGRSYKDSFQNFLSFNSKDKKNHRK